MVQCKHYVMEGNEGTQHRFGYQWNKYSQVADTYRDQFINWTYPLTADFWRGKRVLDAGCGMGRNSLWPLEWGAERVVAFDYDKRSISRATALLGKDARATVEYKSIYDLSWEGEFDVAFSIGVIHHLADPKLALRNMVRALTSGGTLLIWVYGYEGYKWVRDWISPIRIGITSRLPLPLLHFLCYFLSVPLYLYAKLFRKSPYFAQLATFPFWQVQNIVFDQLLPQIAQYWTRDEVVDLVAGLPLESVSVEHPPTGNGWILIATKQ